MTTATRKPASLKRVGHEIGQKLCTERLTAIAFWAVLATVMTLVVWLALISSSTTDSGGELWHLMP